MKVVIDGVVYVPMRNLSDSDDEPCRELVKALASGYYVEMECHRDGNNVAPQIGCDCSGCEMAKIILQLVGKQECKENHWYEEYRLKI